MNAVVDEVLKGYRVVQAFGMEAFESRRFRETDAPPLPGQPQGAQDASAQRPGRSRCSARRRSGLLLLRPRGSSSSGTMTHRHVRLVPARAVLAVHADQATQQGQPGAPGGGGGRGAGVLGDRRAGRDQGPAGRARAAPACARGSASSTCRSPTSPTSRCCATSTSSLPAGRAVALVGAFGRGEVDGGATAAALLGRAGRAHRDRRRRHPRPDARVAARQPRPRHPGDRAVQHHGARQHRVRPGQGGRRPAARVRAGGVRRGVHPRVPRTASTP